METNGVHGKRSQHRLTRLQARQLEDLVNDEREAILAGRYTQDFLRSMRRGS